MPYLPGQDTVYVSRVLANVAVSQAQDLGNFVALQVYPRVPTQQPSGKYHQFPKGMWNKKFTGKRQENEEARLGGFNVIQNNYSCELYAVASDIGQLAQANQDPAIRLRSRKTRWCVQQMYLQMEADWNTAFFASGALWGSVTTSYLTGNSTASATQVVFWNAATGVPLANTTTARTAVMKASGGFDPNTYVMGYAVFQALKTNPELLDRIKYTNDEAITAGIMARYFEVDRLLVCKAVIDTAEVGQTASQDFVMGSNALLCYVNPNPGTSDVDVTAGMTMIWEGLEGSIQGMQVAEIPIPTRRSLRIELQMGYQQLLVAQDCGFMFVAVIG